MPPVRSRCAYLPENFLAYVAGSGWGAPLASPSSVMVGTCDDRTRRELVFQIAVLRLALGQPEAPAVVMDHQTDVIRVSSACGPSDRTSRRRNATAAMRSAK